VLNRVQEELTAILFRVEECFEDRRSSFIWNIGKPQLYYLIS
jgi:hypothetical protein